MATRPARPGVRPLGLVEYGTPAATQIRAIGTAALDVLSFPAGSMGPKIAAARH